MNRFAIENLFGIEGFNIAWYGVLICLGVILAVLLAGYRADKSGYRADLILDLFFVAVPTGIIGARIYFVIFDWDYYRNDLIKVFAFREGGLAIYGGVIGGVLAVLLFAKIRKFPFLKLIDLTIPSLVLGQIVGRWGNFINQEAYGHLITNEKLQFFPYGVYIDALSEWHQATFFYESLFNMVLLVFMLLFSKKQKTDGMILGLYFVGYGIARFFIEGLREDSLYLMPGVRVSQLLSALLAVAGILYMVWLKKYKKPTKAYTGIYLKEKEGAA